MEAFTDIWPLINSGGIVAIGTLVLMWIVRGTLIPRRHHVEVITNISNNYAEMRDDRDFWRTEAMAKTGHVDRALVVADAAVAKGNGAEIPPLGG